jgi:hypothetical protein
MLTHDWRNPERVVPWKPRHRFRVTDAGREAFGRYQDSVTAAQAGPNPRSELDQAKLEWAEGHKLRVSDGIILEDLYAGRSCLAEMQDTLAACDLTLREARGALDRLLAAGLVESLDPVLGS